MQHFINLLTRMQASLWLIPAAMCAAMLGLAYALVFSPLEISWLTASKHWWLFSGDAATARDLMTAILQGIITMTSLVVSITMVVLSLASARALNTMSLGDDVARFRDLKTLPEGVTVSGFLYDVGDGTLREVVSAA